MFPLPLLLFLLCPSPSAPLNFLFFLLGTNHFERHTFEFLAQEFARRGHKVVTVKPILVPEEPRLVKPLLHMVHEKVLKDVLPRRFYEPLERVGQDVPWREKYEEQAHLGPYWAAHNHSCEKMLNSNLLEVLARAQLELAVLYAGNPCQMALAHALGIPFVLVDLEGLSDETLIAAGAPWDLPILALGGPQPITDFVWTFSARLSRALSLFSESLAQLDIPWLSSAISDRHRLLDAPIDALFAGDYEIRRKFRGAFPTVNQLRRMAQLHLANTDPLLESPSMAFPPNLVPIGGIHIDSVRPLFSPWNDTMASGELGVILCSFGTLTNTSGMPEQFVRSLLGAFSRLPKYRIVWRISPGLALPGFSSKQLDTLSEQYPHLNITSYFPQNELLANPRTRLLITNGGAHSLMEALQWGVPMLGIPLYGTNRRNLEKARQRGIALVLEKREAMDERTLLSAMRKALGDPKIARRAQAFGRELHTRPASAFERVLHALETLARRSGRDADGRVPTPTPFRQTHADLWLCIFIAMAILAKLVAFCVGRSGKALAGLARSAARALMVEGGGRKKNE